MELTTEKIGDVIVVILPGEQLDASNAKEFKRDIAPLLGSRRVPVIVAATERDRRRFEAVWDDETGPRALRAGPDAQDIRYLQHEGRGPAIVLAVRKEG
jgi:hypothetical protein